MAVGNYNQTQGFPGSFRFLNMWVCCLMSSSRWWFKKSSHIQDAEHYAAIKNAAFDKFLMMLDVLFNFNAELKPALIIES